MEPLSNSALVIGYIVSNIFAVILLFSASKRPKLTRLLFFLLFGWAFGLNYYLSHAEPGEYLNYANAAVPMYKDFINGWFSQHITQMVSIIAIGQAMIAIGMILNGWWVKIACIGAIVFMMAIAPLGLYAGFPFSIIASIAAVLVLRKDDLNYLWKFNSKKKFYGRLRIVR